MFDVFFDPFSILVSHTIFGANFGAIWVSFWSSFLVKKAYQNQELISTLVPKPFWDQFWHNFGYMLVIFRRDLVAGTASADIAKTMKNHGFFNVLAVSEVSDN